MTFHELLARHPLPPVAHEGKDDRGNVFLIGGPAHCPGAVVLAAEAALRVGAGRVQAAVDPAVAAAVGVAVPEAAVFAWNHAASPPPEIERRIARADVVVLGVGHQHLDDVVTRSVAERATNATLILDAGALHSATAATRLRPVLLAPNPAEARGLLAEPDMDDEEALARALSDRFGQPAAVRGAHSVVAHGQEAWRLDESPAGLGTPGSGDVFIGILAAISAAGADPAGALGWALHLHAEAARRLSSVTPAGYLARDIASELRYARASADSA